MLLFVSPAFHLTAKLQ